MMNFVVGGIYLQYLLNGPEKAVFHCILWWSWKAQFL